MSTKFLHYRRRAADGSVSSTGGKTVAYVEGDEGISYGVAHCNVSDNYNKQYGRAKSAGRILSRDYGRVFQGSRQEFLDFLDVGAVADGYSR